MSKFHINKHGVPAPCRAKPGNCPLGGDESHFSTQDEAQKYADSTFEEEHGLLGKQQQKVKNIRITEADVERIYDEVEGSHWGSDMPVGYRRSRRVGQLKNPITLIPSSEADSSRFIPWSYRTGSDGDFDLYDSSLKEVYSEVIDKAEYPYDDEPIHVVSDKVYDFNTAPRIVGAFPITAHMRYKYAEVEYTKTMSNINDRVNKLNEDLKDFAEKASVKNRKSKTITCKSCGNKMKTEDVPSHGIPTSRWDAKNHAIRRGNKNVPMDNWNKCTNDDCGKTLSSNSVQKAYNSKVERINKLKSEVSEMYEKKVNENPNREVYWSVDVNT